MGARSRLELRQDVPDVRLDRLFREEELLTDLAIDETVADELEHLDLAHRRLLLELPKRALKGNHLCAGATSAPLGDLLEPGRVVRVPAHDLFPLRGVHAPSIGSALSPL